MPRPRSPNPSRKLLSWRRSNARSKNGLTGFYGAASEDGIYLLQYLGLMTEAQALDPNSAKVREAIGQAVTDLLHHLAPHRDDLFDLIQASLKR
jgi:hypothetical protein